MLFRRVLLLAMLVVLPAAVPAGASAAASIRLDHPCYQDNGTPTKATFHADGLAPGSVVPVALDGQFIGNVTANASGSLVASFPVEENDQIMLVTDGGQLIRCPVHDVRIAGRNTQGVRIFKTDGAEKVVSVERITEDEAEAGDSSDED